MKYLLKQKLIKKKTEIGFRLYPNQFSSGLVKIANKKDLILDIQKTKQNGYIIVEYYDFLEKPYKTALSIHKKNIIEKRTKFYQKPLMHQLIVILRYIFNRNKSAKIVKMRSAKFRAYNDKDEFLRIVLDIALKIKQDNFSFGIQIDKFEPIYKYIYYFQIGKFKQVSFHSNNKYPDIPEFEGTWIYEKNNKFPFRLPKG